MQKQKILAFQFKEKEAPRSAEDNFVVNGVLTGSPDLSSYLNTLS